MYYGTNRIIELDELRNAPDLYQNKYRFTFYKNGNGSEYQTFYWNTDLVFRHELILDKDILTCWYVVIGEKWNTEIIVRFQLGTSDSRFEILGVVWKY